MESQITIFLLLVLILAIFLVIFLLLRKKDSVGNDQLLDKMEKQEEKLIQAMERLTNLSKDNSDLRQTLDGKLSETHRATQVQIGETRKIISEVTERLTKLDETNRQVVNFSEQLKNLQDILKNPKQRGVLGEYFLEETLKNVLPPNSYKMQYSFADGTIVDAVVFVKDKIIPIDSKFSLETYEKILNTNDPDVREKLEKQFKQDLKFRIDETSKYVKPMEKTMDFAFMFIPSEAIYYDLLINKVGAVQVNTRDLIEYAFKDKHVIIVSPTSFLAYLQTVLQGLRALQIEESAMEIRKRVETLAKHIITYDDFMKKLGISMTTTVNHYNNAYKEFGKIDKDVVKIAGSESKIEPMMIEKPKQE